ncbi:unnamed protein product [Linum tenue]|uniref:F-box domain-containing protein n=1 Tax=Linum tenue TaxID=586396 RepID=A0AAV0GN89_9ROSI|nr:unnamed protein product [Linum tenue]
MPTAENCRDPALIARPLPCATRKRRRIGTPKGNPNRRRPPPPGSINDLGDDVLAAILIRLPDLSSACRCKSVCRRWSSLIFSPGFNRLFVSHHQGSEPPPPPLLLPSDDFSISILLTFLPVPYEIQAYFTVWDSFKDLVLCGFVQPPEPNGAEVGRTLFVCNPFTKQWVALPLAPERPKGYCQPIASLVCEPRKSINLELDDNGRSSIAYSEYRFRVVCMYVLHQSINLDVFCSESREWTSKALVLDGFLRLKDPYEVVTIKDGE